MTGDKCMMHDKMSLLSQGANLRRLEPTFNSWSQPSTSGPNLQPLVPTFNLWCHFKFCIALSSVLGMDCLILWELLCSLFNVFQIYTSPNLLQYIANKKRNMPPTLRTRPPISNNTQNTTIVNKAPTSIQDRAQSKGSKTKRLRENDSKQESEPSSHRPFRSKRMSAGPVLDDTEEGSGMTMPAVSNNEEPGDCELSDNDYHSNPEEAASMMVSPVKVCIVSSL